MFAVLLSFFIAGEASFQRLARGEEIEVIRGTVERFRPGILSLNDVRLPNGENAGRTVMIIVNKDTDYFDGLVRTTKESVTAGVRVLVKCEPAGTGRVAVLVRIIGGKTPD